MSWSNLVNITLEVEYTKVENGWTQAQLVAFPGVITVQPTRNEAGEAIEDAFLEWCRARTEPTND